MKKMLLVVSVLVFVTGMFFCSDSLASSLSPYIIEPYKDLPGSWVINVYGKELNVNGVEKMIRKTLYFKVIQEDIIQNDRGEYRFEAQIFSDKRLVREVGTVVFDKHMFTSGIFPHVDLYFNGESDRGYLDGRGTIDRRFNKIFIDGFLSGIKEKKVDEEHFQETDVLLYEITICKDLRR